MLSRLHRFASALLPLLILASLLAVSCSDDEITCPVCPPSSAQWVLYDDFNDTVIDTSLWTTTIYYGGQTLEVDSQFQIWGHADRWTGLGIADTDHPMLAWRFDLVESYFEDGAGCQGWHIQAIDRANNATVELITRTTAGCINPGNMGDSTGTYEIAREGDSLLVYKDGAFLRWFPANGIEFFTLRIFADNVYGDSRHCHLFIDNVWGLEWKP